MNQYFQKILVNNRMLSNYDCTLASITNYSNGKRVFLKENPILGGDDIELMKNLSPVVSFCSTQFK